LLAGGASIQAVATKFDLPYYSLRRHFVSHVSAGRKAQLLAGPLSLGELAEKAASEGLALLDYLRLIRSTLLGQFLTASEAGDSNGAATVAGRLLECLRIIATLTGEISRTSASFTQNIAIMSSPMMADLQSMLIRTLQPYPAAREAVLSGLEELSARALAQGPAPLTIEAQPNG
jgi:hypothetical protein